ncbi:TPA: TraE/TraK family type IV conjugative transfer system protein [Legionella pneumophila]
MDTKFRDNAIAKNRLLLKMTLVWAISCTCAVLVLAFLCFYTLTHRQVHWLPLCTGSEFSIGEHDYSASYLHEMTQKAIDLRLTYNPETIDARYATLSHMVGANLQDSFKKILDSERTTVHEKNISSVFYAQKIAVNTAEEQGRVEGLLYRTSHGLQLKPQRKVYLVHFSFHHGLLSLKSILEVADAH